jgi:predicted MFS family arabinose efflux permease
MLCRRFMNAIRNIIQSPWRAVLVLGVTQIISWGTIFYTPVLILPMIAAERGWSIAFAMGGFSVGLLVAGLSAPYIGRSIDRFGGHITMTAGSLTGALGLALITQATNRISYYAAWMVLGLAMAANLYDAAFATLGRIFGTSARRPITVLTLAGGFASTVSWPITHHLLESIGWRGTYLVYAGLLSCVSAPLNALALPRDLAETRLTSFRETKPLAAVLPPYGLSFILVAAAFASYAFVPSGLSAHLLAIFTRSGIDSGTVVWIGALFGPAQVGARLIELMFSRDLHPLWVARFALGILLCAFTLLVVLGVSAPIAVAFALLFGAANGLITITRDALPLALFGASGYGQLTGRLAGPWLMMQAAAPW